jgi:hypothetical protein
MSPYWSDEQLPQSASDPAQAAEMQEFQPAAWAPVSTKTVSCVAECTSRRPLSNDTKQGCGFNGGAGDARAMLNSQPALQRNASA